MLCWFLRWNFFKICHTWNVIVLYCQPHGMGHRQHFNLNWISMDGWTLSSLKKYWISVFDEILIRYMQNFSRNYVCKCIWYSMPLFLRDFNFTHLMMKQDFQGLLGHILYSLFQQEGRVFLNLVSCVCCRSGFSSWRVTLCWSWSTWAGWVHSEIADHGSHGQGEFIQR